LVGVDDMVNLSNAREIDLHGMRHLDAEMKVCEVLEEAWAAGEGAVLFVHGYHGGVALRNYIRGNGGLRSWWYYHFPDLPPLKIVAKDKGSTYVMFSD